MLPGVRGGSPSSQLSGSGGEQFRQSREVAHRHRQREAAQRCQFAMRQNGGHDPAGHVGGQQPVAVLAKHRRDPDGIVDPEAHKPAEQQVVIHLLHELPLGPDRVEDLQQAGTDQPFGRDRGAALTRVEPVEVGIQGAQRVVDDGPDLAKRVSRRNALLEIEVAEQRARHLI